MKTIEAGGDRLNELRAKYAHIPFIIMEQVNKYLKEFNNNPFPEFSKEVEIVIGSVKEKIIFYHTNWINPKWMQRSKT